MIPILILAAGASTRMRGVDKLMLDVDGVPLLRRQALVASSVSADVRIALPPRPHPRYDAVQDLPVHPVEISDASEGIGASLRRVFATLEPNIQRAMVVLADVPDITADDLQKVMDATKSHPDALVWRGATAQGVGGHPMIIARPLFDDFQSLAGDNGGQSIVRRAADALHLVPFKDNRARLDLDTPEAWAAWRAARQGDLT